jgi:hypothetical protein
MEWLGDEVAGISDVRSFQRVVSLCEKAVLDYLCMFRVRLHVCASLCGFGASLH